jgi:hypothetical protein
MYVQESSSTSFFYDKTQKHCDSVVLEKKRERSFRARFAPGQRHETETCLSKWPGQRRQIVRTSNQRQDVDVRKELQRRL